MNMENNLINEYVLQNKKLKYSIFQIIDFTK